MQLKNINTESLKNAIQQMSVIDKALHTMWSSEGVSMIAASLYGDKIKRIGWSTADMGFKDAGDFGKLRINFNNAAKIRQILCQFGDTVSMSMTGIPDGDTTYVTSVTFFNDTLSFTEKTIDISYFKTYNLPGDDKILMLAGEDCDCSVVLDDNTIKRIKSLGLINKDNPVYEFTAEDKNFCITESFAGNEQDVKKKVYCLNIGTCNSEDFCLKFPKDFFDCTNTSDPIELKVYNPAEDVAPRRAVARYKNDVYDAVVIMGAVA